MCYHAIHLAAASVKHSIPGSILLPLHSYFMEAVPKGTAGMGQGPRGLSYPGGQQVSTWAPLHDMSIGLPLGGASNWHQHVHQWVKYVIGLSFQTKDIKYHSPQISTWQSASTQLLEEPPPSPENQKLTKGATQLEHGRDELLQDHLLAESVGHLVDVAMCTKAVLQGKWWCCLQKCLAETQLRQLMRMESKPILKFWKVKDLNTNCVETCGNALSTDVPEESWHEPTKNSPGPLPPTTKCGESRTLQRMQKKLVNLTKQWHNSDKASEILTEPVASAASTYSKLKWHQLFLLGC